MARIETPSLLDHRSAISRRELLRVGALGVGGLSLPGLLRCEQAHASTAAHPSRAKSVIVLFLSGGPAHMDMWDMKPNAPAEIRGTFRPTSTNVPGIQVSEHLPGMARNADKYAILRAVHHKTSSHPAACYWMMVGSAIARPVPESNRLSREDRPHLGSALAKVLGPRSDLPACVMVPEAIQPNGPVRSGQHAGFLGPAYDPYLVHSDPNLADYSPGPIGLLDGLSPRRLQARLKMLDAWQGSAADPVHASEVARFDTYYQRACDLVSSPAAQKAFRIDEEPDATRDRYGRHVFGQSVLLARRLIEAGVRLVHVNWVRHDGGKGGQGYDSHRDHLAWAKKELLPPTDAAFTALLDDLDERGLLDETLVLMMGEFGRTPRFNKNAGRDHWPHCFSAVLAGGGIRGGQVHGASDKIGAYPVDDAVSPDDIIATVLHRLGIDPHTTIYDLQARPHRLVEGTPISAIL